MSKIRNILRKIKNKARNEPCSQLKPDLLLVDQIQLITGRMGVGVFFLVGYIAKEVAGPACIISFAIAGLAILMPGKL